MSDFNENNQWVPVVKPENVDYNIAEKTTVNFSAVHSFLAGDYLTEISSGASGVVYESVTNMILNMARDSSTVFPATGSLGNGVATVAYSSISSTHGITNEVTQDLVDRTKWLYENKANKNLNISVGNGLTGGGDLSATVNVSLATPQTITSSSNNSANSTGHTHAVSISSTTQAGVVQLNDSLTSTSTSLALTAAQGKVLNDSKASKTITVTGSNGLTGGGDLSSNKVISMGTPTTLNGNTNNSTSGSTHTHAISAATDSLRGVVELATVAEVLAGSDDTRAVTPFSLNQGKLFNSNGWTKLYNGLIIQWGYNSSGNGVYHAFPLTFPSACFSVVVTMNYNANVDRNINVYSVSSTGYYTATATTYDSYFIAIGY